MPRRGYTLLELLLVLAVLAAMSGVVLPAVLRFTSEQGLKDAGESVRRECDRTRQRAIQAGTVWQFRHEAGGGRYIALPFERNSAATAAETAGLGAGSGTPAAPVPGGPAVVRPAAGTVSERFLLTQPAGRSTVAETLPTEAFTGLPEALTLAQARWAPPILFLPDGSSTGGMVQVGEARGPWIDVTVRDLTGMASSSPPRGAAP